MPEELNPPQNQPPATTPESAAPPAAPEVPAPPPAKPAIVAKLEELGFQGIADENEGIERLIQAYKQQKDQFGNEIKQALAEVRQQVVPQAHTPQPANGGWWNPPQVDLTTAAQFRTADGGWKEGTPAEVKSQFAAYEAYRSNFANKLLDNPEQALEPLLQKKFEEYFERKYTQVSQEQQERAYFDRAIRENDWIFEKDPLTGARANKLSAEGARFNELMASLEGETDHQGNLVVRYMPKSKAFETALRIRAAEKAAAAAKVTSPEQAAEINRQKQADLLNRASPPGSRAGSLPSPAATPPRNRNLTPGQKLLQELERAGGGGVN